MRRRHKIKFGDHHVKKVEPYLPSCNNIMSFVDLCENQKLYPATDSICAGLNTLCFENALRLYENADDRVKLMYGYFLYRDGFAGHHSWLMIDNKIIDTTVDCVAYSGVEMTVEQVKKFAQHMKDDEDFPFFNISEDYYRCVGVITDSREETTNNILSAKDTEESVIPFNPLVPNLFRLAL